MSHPSILGSLVLVLAATGCAATSADGTGADEALTARTGYFKLPIANAVYQSIAVVGDAAFLGTNDRTIDVVDLKTKKKTGSVGVRVDDDSLTTMGSKVVACGVRDDTPPSPYAGGPAPDRSYVLTVIDAATKKVDGEVKLGIEKLLDSNPSGGFVDLPKLSCRFDAAAGTMAVTFSQPELGQERIVFPMPALGTSAELHAIPGAVRTKLATGGDDTLDAAATSPNGITYAAGGYGLRRLAPGAARAKSFRAESREQMVDLAIRDGKIFAVDNGGALVVANDATGATIERVAIPDYLEGVALTPGHVIVVGRSGLFVAADRW